MAVIYVREQGSVVRKRGGRILVEKDDKVLLEIPLRKTGSVAVFGNVQVTTQALSELLERAIPLALYTRNGRLKGHLAPEASKNILLRLAQFKLSQDGPGGLRVAAALVRAKLWNCAALVADYRANYPSPLLGEVRESLLETADKAGLAGELNELLGYEGSGAAAYFKAFAAVNRSELPFDGRERYPATDPVNALLSLGYTMVMNEIRSLVEGAGMEPHLGFLHRVEYGRPSLALDLLEPFRSVVVDRLVLRLINERILTGEDFARRAGGPRAGSVVLVPLSFHRFLEYYEAAMCEARKAAPQGMREVLCAEVEKLARCVRTGAVFVPFLEED